MTELHISWHSRKSLFLDQFLLLKIKMQKFLPLLVQVYYLLVNLLFLTDFFKNKTKTYFFSTSIIPCVSWQPILNPCQSIRKQDHPNSHIIPFPRQWSTSTSPCSLLPFIALNHSYSCAVLSSLMTISNSTCLCRWKLGLWMKKGNLMGEALPIITNTEMKNWE